MRGGLCRKAALFFIAVSRPKVRHASRYGSSRLVMFTRKSGLVFSAGSIS